jgi:hypothetical protein
MNIKKHELYPIYLFYLEAKNLSNGHRKLAEISKDMFVEFENRYINEPTYKDKIDSLYLPIKRNNIIDSTIGEEEFEIITEHNKISDDDFFDF